MTPEGVRADIRRVGELEVARLELLAGKTLDPRLRNLVMEVAENSYINGMRQVMAAIESRRNMVPLCELLDDVEGQNWRFSADNPQPEKNEQEYDRDWKP